MPKGEGDGRYRNRIDRPQGLSCRIRFGGIAPARRLLERATGNAFARLTAENGFWDSSVARLGLPDILGSRGGTLEGMLVSALFRERLQRRLIRKLRAAVGVGPPRATADQKFTARLYRYISTAVYGISVQMISESLISLIMHA